MDPLIKEKNRYKNTKRSYKAAWLCFAFGFIIVLVLFLYFRFNFNFAVDQNESNDKLDDMIIQRRNIEVDFLYGNGGNLDVWKDPNYFRYYVTPICELVASDVTCIKNEYDLEHPYTIIMPIRLWEEKAAEAAALAIAIRDRHNKTVEPEPGDFRPLPIDSARLSTTIKTNIQFPSDFYPNVLKEGNIARFKLYPPTMEMCSKIVNDSREDTYNFLEKIGLYKAEKICVV